MGILRTNKISGLETPTPVTGSVYFDGSGDLLIVSSSDFAFGTGDCTVEGWGYVTSHINYRVLATTRPTNLGYGDAWHIGCDVNGTLLLYSNAFNLQSANNAVPTNQWFHWAFTRNNGTGRLFVNGTIVASGSVTNNYAGTLLGIGDFPTTQAEPWSGYISNLRILKGTALYTSNFTPPVHELQPIGDTVLLCCNNPDSAGAEATGKAITVNGNAAASTFSPGLTRDFTYGTQFEGVAKFDTQGYFVPPSGTTEQRGRGRGVFGGGYTSTFTVLNTIDYVQIQSTGNAQDFGDLTTTKSRSSSCSSYTRGIFNGGYITISPASNTLINVIEYITISTTSNSVDFGDLSETKQGIGACSNSTRGLFGGGATGLAPANTNKIEYITIASLGNSVTFGNLTQARRGLASCSSPTRGVFGGGVVFVPSTSRVNIIDFVTIASTGDAIDFGDLTVSRNVLSSSSSSIRGLFGGGYTASPTATSFNTIDCITIATTGNAQDFGDLTTLLAGPTSCSNSIRGLFGGGSPTFTNLIEYVVITSTGNSVDFGDLTQIRSNAAACSDSHGGIS
jgi:hypothetical protein